jgi:hypothetical protein
MKVICSIRLLGSETAVQATSHLLTTTFGENVHIGAVRKGRKEGRDDYLAYGTVVVDLVEETDLPQYVPLRTGEEGKEGI